MGYIRICKVAVTNNFAKKYSNKFTTNSESSKFTNDYVLVSRIILLILPNDHYYAEIFLFLIILLCVKSVQISFLEIDLLLLLVLIQIILYLTLQVLNLIFVKVHQ